MVKPQIPFRITPTILQLSHEIEMICEYLYPLLSKKLKTKLNKETKNKTIESFLSMEENILSLLQVKNILAGKVKFYRLAQVQEVKNVSRIYRHLKRFDPLSPKDFKLAHSLLMNGLDENKGRWRKYQVVVVEGKKVTHVPPKPKDIPSLMLKLFQDIKKNRELSWVVKACVFHYGIQYIHPFIDGNGRMGRIWQHLLLLKLSPIFHYILIGNLIKNNATAYYRSLDKSDVKNNGAIFVEFCLTKIKNELKKLSNEVIRK